jgi:Arc/MetJ family transcription regulator
MHTNIVIDDKLMKQAMHATGLTTERAVVEAGLRLLAEIHEQRKIQHLRGKITWEGDLEKSRANRAKGM